MKKILPTKPGRAPGFFIQLRPTSPALVAPIIWQAVQGDADLPPDHSYDQFRAHLMHCYSFLGVYAGRELVGAIGYEGDELHAAVLPAWHGRWFSTRIGAQIAAYGLARGPLLRAYVRADDRVTGRLCAAIGFVRVAGGEWEEWRLGAPAPERQSAA